MMKLTNLTTALAGALMIAGVANAADEKHFDGFYLGAEVGRSVGDGSDTTYYGLTGTFRKQMDSGLVLGLEGTFGENDYFNVDYTWSLNATLGYAFGDDKRNLIFAGAGNRVNHGNFIRFTTEDPDPLVFETFHNINDFNAFVGYERAIGSHLSFRAKAEFKDFERVTPIIGLGLRF